MPNILDKIPFDCPFFDGRTKLIPCQKESIKRMKDMGASINSMARMYGVSKRIIQFILYPERLERNRQLRAERGGSKIYYKRSEQTKAIAKHRGKKKEVFSIYSGDISVLKPNNEPDV